MRPTNINKTKMKPVNKKMHFMNFQKEIQIVPFKPSMKVNFFSVTTVKILPFRGGPKKAQRKKTQQNRF